MRYEHQNWPDWRDADAYRPLLGADRALFAWEWLRRDPAYRRAATQAIPKQIETEGSRGSEARPEHWGLHRFEPSDRPAFEARPQWTAEVYPFVLQCRAEPCIEPRDCFDLGAAATLLTRILLPGGRHHLLICDGLRYLRLDVADAGRDRRVMLRYLIAGCESAEAPLLTLRRLIAICGTGSFPRTLYPDEVRAARWVLQLRVHDAVRDGCDQRKIASVLFSPSAAAPKWRSDASSIRSQVQRLVRNARLMAGGEYRRLLGKPIAHRGSAPRC